MDKKVKLVDSRKTYDCPFDERWMNDRVKVNSGYCRSACSRRNYKVKSPSDYIVACNKEVKK